MSSLGQSLYDDTASFGRFWALLGAIIATVIGLILIVGGIVALTRHVTPKEKLTGTIAAINSNSQAGFTCPLNAGTFTCTLRIAFQYNGQPITVDYNYSGTSLYSVGQNVDVYIDANNPLHISLDPPMPGWAGWVMIIFGVAIAALGWFGYWMARRWKIAAAAQGVGGISNIIRTVL